MEGSGREKGYCSGEKINEYFEGFRTSQGTTSNTARFHK
jgi:hypothetical protein